MCSKHLILFFCVNIIINYYYYCSALRGGGGSFLLVPATLGCVFFSLFSIKTWTWPGKCFRRGVQLRLRLSARNVSTVPPPTKNQKSTSAPAPTTNKPHPPSEGTFFVWIEHFYIADRDRPLLSVFIDIFSTIFASFALQILFRCGR